MVPRQRIGLDQDWFPENIFRNLGKLEKLYLEYNNITDATDEDFVAAINDLASLQWLSLRRNNLEVPIGEDRLLHAEWIACHFPGVRIILTGNPYAPDRSGRVRFAGESADVLRSAEWCEAQPDSYWVYWDVSESDGTSEE